MGVGGLRNVNKVSAEVDIKFYGNISNCFGRLIFSRKFEDIKDFSNRYFGFLEDLEIFLHGCLNIVEQVKK